MERDTRVAIWLDRTYWAVCLALVLVSTGCGGSDAPEPAAEAETKSKPAVASATPDEAVHELMMAYKTGDEAKASALVTEKTRQEVERTGWGVSPPGSKFMEFKVGEVQYVSEAKDLAHVACHIDDVDEAGKELNTDVVWFLRKEPPGWRVAGMAIKIFPDALPVLLNFEDMDDMERKIKLVKEEEARREEEQQAIKQAQQPPTDATRTQ